MDGQDELLVQPRLGGAAGRLTALTYGREQARQEACHADLVLPLHAMPLAPWAEGTVTVLRRHHHMGCLARSAWGTSTRSKAAGAVTFVRVMMKASLRGQTTDAKRGTEENRHKR